MNDENKIPYSKNLNHLRFGYDINVFSEPGEEIWRYYNAEVEINIKKIYRGPMITY